MKTIVISVRVSLPTLATIIESVEKRANRPVGKSESCSAILQLWAEMQPQTFSDSESALRFLESRNINVGNFNNKRLVSILQSESFESATLIPKHIADDVNEALKNLKP